MAQSNPRANRAFLSLFLVAGVVMVGIGFWNLFRSVQCARWPTAEGLVTASRMERHSGDDGDTFSAEVSYVFTVADKRYEGNRLAFGAMSSSADYAQGVLKRYPVEQRVTVHYSPNNPQVAVLETGVHGGTWICFVVGAVFVLASIMFLQVSRAADNPQTSGALVNSSAKTWSSGRVTTDQPPVLMGVIFLLAGAAICFLPPSRGTPPWVVYAAGGLFVSGGILLLLYRLQNKSYSRIATVPVLLAFLAIFHWVSFGAGDRTGTVSGSFMATHMTNVRMPFAIFTILLDLAIFAGLIRWLVKRGNE